MTLNIKRECTDGMYPNAKKTRIDEIQNLVGSYLSQRNYSETELQRKCLTAEEYMTRLLVDNEMSSPDSIAFSSIEGNMSFHAVEEYFTKFLSWIESVQTESLGNDLNQIVYPLFCHSYLDLLFANECKLAASFLQLLYKIPSTCYQDDFIMKLLEEMTNINNSLDDKKQSPLINAFRSSKYKIRVSFESLNLLKKFLLTRSYIVFLRILHMWFDFDITMLDIKPTVNITESEEHYAELCNGDIKDAGVITDDPELAELQEAVSFVRVNPAPLLLINVYNGQDRVTCGIADYKRGRVVAGFSTSELRIWPLGGKRLNCTSSRNVSKLPLACDIGMPDIENPFDAGPLTPTGAVVLRGHSESIQDVRFVPNADILLSVSHDCSMRAWRLADHSSLVEYRGHNSPIWCLGVSAEGTYAATGSYDQTVKLWSLENRFPLRIYSGHTLDVNSVDFHPNAMYIVSGSTDKTIRMWSVSEAKCVRLLMGHTGTVHSVAFSADGKFIASGGEDKIVRIWDITAAKQLAELKGSTETITGLSWDKQGGHLVSISLDGYVKVWDTQAITRSGCAEQRANFDIISEYYTERSSLLSICHTDDWLICVSTSVAL